MMDSKSAGAAWLAGAAAVATVFAGNTFAQAAPTSTPTAGAAVSPQDRSGDQLQAIIVTAEKRSEQINTVPMSINAETGDQLAAAGVTDTSQLAKVIPGFVFQNSTYGLPVYGMRGVSFYDTSGASPPAVSIYVDQVPLPYSTMTRGAGLDAERVEVLKGPQGTLFGENSTGGAINYIAAKPTKDFSTGADLSFGRFNEADVSAFVSGPISNTLGARLAVSTEQRGGWQHSLTRDATNGRRDLTNARLLLDFVPRDDLRFELNVNGWLDRSDTPAAQFVRFQPVIPPGCLANPLPCQVLGATPPAPNKAQAADWDPGLSLKRDDKFKQVGLRADWDITSQMTLTSLSSYDRLDTNDPVDLDGTSFKNAADVVFDHFDVTSQELRLAGTEGALKWMVGGNYEYDHLFEYLPQDNNGSPNVTPPAPPPFGVYYNGLYLNNVQRVTTRAAFGSLDYKVLPNLTLQGSARYTAQDRTLNYCSGGTAIDNYAYDAAFGALSSALSGSPTVNAPGACVTMGNNFKPLGPLQRSLNQDNVSWRLGASWQATPDLLVYGNATKGYKAGSFSNIPVLEVSQLQPVTQESILAYEVGTKATLLDGSLQANAAVFYYQYQDKQIQGQVYVFPLGDLPGVVNVPKSYIDGVELALSWRPISAITTTVGVTYINSDVSSSFAALDPGTATGINLKGYSLPNTPPWQVNADVEYATPVAAEMTGFANASVTYVDKSVAAFTTDSVFLIPSYTTLDLRLGIRGGLKNRWEAEIWGRNVTNTFVITNVLKTYDEVVRYTALPATYGVRLSFRH